MPDDKLPQRTLKTTFTIAVLFSILFLARGQAQIAFGLAVGAMLGLVSLWSLTVAVPRLFASPNAGSRFGLGMLMLLKLPFYGVVLNFAMTSPAVSPFSVFVGVALIPVVLVLKTVGYNLVSQGSAAARPINSFGD